MTTQNKQLQGAAFICHIMYKFIPTVAVRVLTYIIHIHLYIALHNKYLSEMTFESLKSPDVQSGYFPALCVNLVVEFGAAPELDSQRSALFGGEQCGILMSFELK